MSVGTGSRPIAQGDLEAWLGRVLVPVEPGEPFIARLRGRLIELRGARPTRGWTLLLIGLGLVVGGALWFSAALRLLAAGAAIIGLLLPRKEGRPR